SPTWHHKNDGEDSIPIVALYNLPARHDQVRQFFGGERSGLPVQHGPGERGAARLDSALDADPLAGARAHDVRNVPDEPGIRDRGADGPVRGVTVRDAGLGHDVPEEVLDCVL